MKNKKILREILLTLFISIACFIIFPSVVNGADTFTTTNGITVTKSTVSQDGTLEFVISKASFDEEKEYVWGIATTKSKDSIEDWYGLSIGSTATIASFNLSDNDSKIKEILYTTDTAYLYVKEKQDEIYIIDGLKLDLTLNHSELVKYEEYSWGCKIYDIYGISPAAYQFVKVEKGENAPETGWKSMDYTYTSLGYSEIKDENWVSEEGTYYLWVKYMESGSKIIYGNVKVTLDDNGPTVTSIQIVSPTSGTYKTPQTVKINVYFSETIKGATVPTLKVRFGDSAERSLTNGTIKNTGYSRPCIEYTYNIQDSDKGQLQAVSLAGGNITDEAGNAAVLTCPVLTGGITIKANTEGTTTNQTDNQDENNNQTNNANDNNQTTTNENDNKQDTSNNEQNTNNNLNNNNQDANQGENNNQDTNKNKETNTNEKDTTIAKDAILPQTGVSYIVVLALAIVIGIGIVLFLKYKRMEYIQ